MKPGLQNQVIDVNSTKTQKDLMSNLNLKRHPDENWFDKITLQSTLHGKSAPHIRIYQNERYKTSGMSGDEWRFSWRHGIYVADEGKEDWCNGAEYSVHAAIAMFGTYPFMSCPPEEKEIFGTPYKASFYHCGHELASRNYATLLEALLTLGRDIVLIPESEVKIFDKREELAQQYCSQPGCTNKPISVYQIIKEYDSRGVEVSERYLSRKPLHRHFCAEHLRRGDCGLDDSDANYKVVSGPGPDDSVVNSKKVSESFQMFI